MNIKFDFANMWNIAVAISLISVSVLYVVISLRKGIAEINRANAEGWKSAAELKQNEIDTLKAHYKELKTQSESIEKKMQNLQNEYHEVLKLNLALQLEKQKWETERADLWRRLSELEKANKI